MKSSKRKNGRVGSSEIASLLSDGLIAPQSSRRTRTPTTSLQTFGEILANPTRTLRSDRAASRNSSNSSSADTDSAPPEQRRRTTAAAAAAPQPQHRDELVVLQEREKACTAYIDDLRSLVQRMQKDIEQLEARRTALEAAIAAATTAAAASAPPPPPPPPVSSVAASPPAPEPAASTPAAAATEAAETPAQVAEPSSG